MLLSTLILENIIEDVKVYNEEKEEQVNEILKEQVKEQIRESINEIASEFETYIVNSDKLTTTEQGLLDVSSSGFMDQGIVTSFKDGIAIVKGLKNVRSGSFS